VLHQEHRGGEHIDEEAHEEETNPQACAHERRLGKSLSIGAEQIAGGERLTLMVRQGFGQVAPAQHQQRQGKAGEEDEDRPPAQQGFEPAADHRGHRRRQGEHDGHVGHQLLGLSPIEEIPDQRPGDDDAGSRRHALQQASQPQHLDAGRQGAEHRGQGKQGEAGEYHPLAPIGVGQGAVPQGHQGKRRQVVGQRLLYRQLTGAQLAPNGMERRQVGVDGKRAEGGHGCQQQGQPPRRCHGR